MNNDERPDLCMCNQNKQHKHLQASGKVARQAASHAQRPVQVAGSLPPLKDRYASIYNIHSTQPPQCLSTIAGLCS